MEGKWEEEDPLSVTLQGLYRAIGVAETRTHAPPEPVETNYKRLISKSPWREKEITIPDANHLEEPKPTRRRTKTYRETMFPYKRPL
jgi:hypothetical protein